MAIGFFYEKGTSNLDATMYWVTFKFMSRLKCKQHGTSSSGSKLYLQCVEGVEGPVEVRVFIKISMLHAQAALHFCVRALPPRGVEAGAGAETSTSVWRNALMRVSSDMIFAMQLADGARATLDMDPESPTASGPPCWQQVRSKNILSSLKVPEIPTGSSRGSPRGDKGESLVLGNITSLLRRMPTLETMKASDLEGRTLDLLSGTTAWRRTARAHTAARRDQGAVPPYSLAIRTSSSTYLGER